MLAPLQRVAALGLALVLPFPSPAAQTKSAETSRQKPAQPDPKQAQKALQSGKEAEAAGRLQEALTDYDRAARLNPLDAAPLERSTLLRSRLIHARLDEAERLALSGEIEKAKRELRAALDVDPGNGNVAERLSQIAEMAQSPVPAPQQALAGLPKLRPRGGRQTFHLSGDVQALYQEVARAFDLKVVFDPDLPARSARLKIKDVGFGTALDVLQTQTGTFVRVLDEKAFFVAQDSPAKRRQYASTVEQTFLLPEAVTSEEMAELLRIVRDISGSAHIQLNPANRSITLRDAPGTVALAGGLLEQAAKARGELMLDIMLLQVDRKKAVDLGITPPSSARLISIDPNKIKELQQAKDLTTLITLIQQIFGGTSASGVIPPVIALGGGKTTMLARLPDAAATFSDALTLVQSGRRVLMRAQDGKPATLFVGDRFPITLSLLSSSIGTTVLGATPSPSLIPRSDFAVGKVPVAVVADDFTADGLRDLAVVNHNDNSITILLNQGLDKFAEATGSPIVLPAGQTAPAAIASGVFDEASNQTDLVVTNQTSNNLTVLHGDGTGAFTQAAGSPIPVGNSPIAIAVGKFNTNLSTNNHLDLAVANFTDNTISVLLGNGAGGFAPAAGSPIALPPGETGPTALVAVDLNNDGKTDLAVVNRSSNNVSILLGNGDGTFAPATGSPVAVGTGPVAIAAGDLNQDSRPDLAIVNQTDNTLTLLLNNGDATFTAASNSPLPTGTTPAGVAIADFNADNRADLAVTNTGVDSVGIYFGLGAGQFAPRFELPAAPNGQPGAIVATDLDNNGSPDIAFTEQNTNQISVIFAPASFTAGIAGLAQQPYPGSEYVDLGVKVKATPAMHPDNEVTLQLEFEIRALSGQSVNGIPILSNRTLTQTVRVKQNETTLIGGLFDEEETRSLSGLPVLGQLPAAGRFFGAHNRQSTESELLILVTPRRLRLPNRISRTIYAGRGGAPPFRGEPGVPP